MFEKSGFDTLLALPDLDEGAVKDTMSITALGHVRLILRKAKELKL